MFVIDRKRRHEEPSAEFYDAHHKRLNSGAMPAAVDAGWLSSGAMSAGGAWCSVGAAPAVSAAWLNGSAMPTGGAWFSSGAAPAAGAAWLHSGAAADAACDMACDSTVETLCNKHPSLRQAFAGDIEAWHRSGDRAALAAQGRGRQLLRQEEAGPARALDEGRRGRRAHRPRP